MTHLDRTIRSTAAPDNGGRRDFEARYRQHFRLLVSMYRARGLEAATAEDLAQETLVRAYASLRRFDPSRPMWPWVKAIGRRVAADHRRRPSREFPAELGDGPSIPSETARVDERGILDLARRELTRRQDLAVRLRYEEDREPGQAAAALGVSVTAFNQLLFRARQRLREEYRRLSEGTPVLVWLRWRRGRWQSLRRRLHREISAASGRAGDAADRMVGAGALSVCLVLVPLSPFGDTPPAVEAGPDREPPPILAHEPPAKDHWRPAAPPRPRGRDAPVPRETPEHGTRPTEDPSPSAQPTTPQDDETIPPPTDQDDETIPPPTAQDGPVTPGESPGEGPAGGAAGESTPEEPPNLPPAPVPEPREPPPPEPALADPDPLEIEPDPEDLAEEVLSHPALKGGPEEPIDTEGIELP